jgi:hypothetical protein
MIEEIEQDIRDFIQRAQVEAKIAYETHHHDLHRYRSEIAQTRSFEKKLIKKARRLPAERRQSS